MTDIMTPATCQMPRCENPVENPKESYLKIPVVDDSIQIVICDRCKSKIAHPSFQFSGN